MKSALIESLKLQMQPVCVILTNERPADGLHLKEDSRRGCVGSMLVAASKKNKLAFFDRKSFGCPGGGVGLGFGNQFGTFPIDCLLSTGNKEAAEKMGPAGAVMAEGERFYKAPGIAKKWVHSLPITDVPAEYVVFKPWRLLADDDEPEIILFFVNGDQLSALLIMADYAKGTNKSITAPFGAACQSILFGYAEARKEHPSGIIGFFDISQRMSVDREILSFTFPYKMFLEMDSNVEGSFLETHAWKKLQERQ